MKDVTIKELLLHLLKLKKDINLEDILSYNGILKENFKKIKVHLFFLLIIEKNIYLEIIMILFIVVLIMAQFLDAPKLI